LDLERITLCDSIALYFSNVEFYQRTIALKQRNPDLKVMLGIGGWSDSGDDKYSALAHSAEGRRKFARETLIFLKERGFDGLSLDWHYPKCWQSQCDAGPDADRQAFSELIKVKPLKMNHHVLSVYST
jgi:chitinase